MQQKNWFAAYVRHYSLYAAWTIALIAMFGSLYFSQVQGLIPCTLCWYQRIVMYPLVIILAIGIFKNDHGIKDYAAPLSVIGIAVAFYQVLLQQGWVKDIGVCSATANCAVKQAVLFNSITIPMLSLLAFIGITFFLIINKHSEEIISGK
jgi:disulfide bond formation protein DsbB